MDYKFINGSNFAQKQLELINYMFAHGAEDLTEEQVEVMRFYFGDKLDTSTIGKTKLTEEFIKDLIILAVKGDRSGQNALFILDLANLYADYWGEE